MMTLDTQNLNILLGYRPMGIRRPGGKGGYWMDTILRPKEEEEEDDDGE